MKKIYYLLLVIIIAAVGFSSCDDDDDDVTPKPTIAVTASATSGWRTDVISYEVTVSSNEDLKTMVITTDPVSALQKLDSTFDNNTHSATFTWSYTIPNSAVDGTSHTITFTVTDKVSSNTTSKSITITDPGSGGGPITTYSGKILGSFNNATGSFFGSADGTVYTVSEAKNNQGSVDWLYFYGATNLATLAAPDDADAYTISTYQLDTWTTKNTTRFRKTSSVVWADVTDDVIIVAEADNTTINTKANQLAINDIIAFITAGGKKGLIKIVSIQSANDGKITIDVKVQQ